MVNMEEGTACKRRFEKDCQCQDSDDEESVEIIGSVQKKKKSSHKKDRSKNGQANNT